MTDSATGSAEKLRGSELIAFLAEAKVSGMSQSETARQAGWVTTNGRVDVNGMFKEYAKTTLDLPMDKASRGKALTYEVGIAKNSNVLVGGSYVKQLGWPPFERVGITVNIDDRSITLRLKE